MSGESKERFFSFLERWEEVVDTLSPEDLHGVMKALCGIAFRSEEPDTAKLSPLARMAMLDLRSRIVWERDLRAARSAAGSKGAEVTNNGKQSANSRQTVGKQSANSRQTVGKTQDCHQQSERQNGGSFEETGKGKGQKESTATAVRKKADFLSWTPEEFRRQAAAAAAGKPEWLDMLDEFCSYWLAEDRRGGPHFRHMETWSMAGRLATWARKRREDASRRPVLLHPAELTPEEAGRMIEEAQRA